jgi:hypothetical protein
MAQIKQIATAALQLRNVYGANEPLSNASQCGFLYAIFQSKTGPVTIGNF